MTGSGAMPVTETSVAPLSARSLKECLVPTARTRPPAATARWTSLDRPRGDHLARGEPVRP